MLTRPASQIFKWFIQKWTRAVYVLKYFSDRRPQYFGSNRATPRIRGYDRIKSTDLSIDSHRFLLTDNAVSIVSFVTWNLTGKSYFAVKLVPPKIPADLIWILFFFFFDILVTARNRTNKSKRAYHSSHPDLNAEKCFDFAVVIFSRIFRHNHPCLGADRILFYG